MTSRPACSTRTLQDLEFERRQADRLARRPGRCESGVELELADPDARPAASGPAGDRRRPAQDGADPRLELGHPERLGQVVIGTGLEGQDLVHLAIPGGQDEDRGGPAARTLLDHDQAVPVGQAQVEQDQVRADSTANAAEGRRGVRRLDRPHSRVARAGPRPGGGSRHRPRRAGSACRSSRSRGGPQVEVHGQAAQLGRSRVDRAAHRLDQAADDGQAQAGAPPGALAAPGNPVELLEQVGQGLGRDARPGVLDRQLDPPSPEVATRRSGPATPGPA